MVNQLEPQTSTVFIVTAPSGAGKTSLLKQLIERTDGLAVCVSHTTRAQRDGEVDGVAYHFATRETFEAMKAADEFLESAEVFGNYYGTSVRAVEAVVQSGSDVVLEIDWQGAAQARQKLTGTVSIFILPPSREVLLDRLQGRGTDSADVIAKRTAEAVEEMRHHVDADYLVINDDFEQALEELQAIVAAERARMARRRQESAALIASLLEQ